MLGLTFEMWLWLWLSLGRYGVDINTCFISHQDEMHIAIECEAPDGGIFPVTIDLQEFIPHDHPKNDAKPANQWHSKSTARAPARSRSRSTP